MIGTLSTLIACACWVCSPIRDQTDCLNCRHQLVLVEAESPARVFDKLLGFLCETGLVREEFVVHLPEHVVAARGFGGFGGDGGRTCRRVGTCDLT